MAHGEVGAAVGDDPLRVGCAAQTIAPARTSGLHHLDNCNKDMLLFAIQEEQISPSDNR